MGKSAGEIEGGIRAALRYCSLEAAGLWCLMRYVIDESDRPGHLRQNGRPLSAVQLAREAGCTADAVARLQQELADAGLIVHADRTWHAPPLARLSALRSQTASRVQRHRARRLAPANQTPTGRRSGRADPALPAQPDLARGALRNAACNADVTPRVTPRVPPEGFPPTPPLPNPPPSVPSERADAAAVGGGTAGRPGMVPAAKARRPHRRERVLTDEQQSVRLRLQDWWINHGWPERHHGAVYEFGGADGSAVMRLLRAKAVSWNFDRAQALLLVYLRQPEMYGAVGHPLATVAARLNHYVSLLAQAEKGHHAYGSNVNNGRPRPARGEYADALPVAGRRLDGGDDGDDEAEPA